MLSEHAGLLDMPQRNARLATLRPLLHGGKFED